MIIFIKFIKIYYKSEIIRNSHIYIYEYMLISSWNIKETCHSMLRESIVYESSQGEETECPVCAGKEELFCRGMSEPNN